MHTSVLFPSSSVWCRYFPDTQSKGACLLRLRCTPTRARARTHTHTHDQVVEFEVPQLLREAEFRRLIAGGCTAQVDLQSGGEDDGRAGGAGRAGNHAGSLAGWACQPLPEDVGIVVESDQRNLPKAHMV